MKSLAIAALAAAAIAIGSPAAAQPSVDAGAGAVVRAPLPASTVEYDAYGAVVRETLTASGRNHSRLMECKSWVCYSTFLGRIDNILTSGIQWMYQHPALPCYQAQQQRVTKGMQELRGGYRLFSRALGTGADWRAKAAINKINDASQVFGDLPAHTCPA